MTTKEIQHELARIATMTDKQLSVRYNRMTNEKKIKNFLDALVSTTRHITLQEKINQDWPGFNNLAAKIGQTDHRTPTYTTRFDDYYIQAPDDPSKVMLFRSCIKRGSDTFPKEDHVRFYAFCKHEMTNQILYKDLDKARELWKERVTEGWRHITQKVVQKLGVNIEALINV